ncbi:MAG: DUF3754 domain-containing protein [Myxococcales bacterium]|nr:DUF3754 domain-containing protein [Myxococcales bacterium]MCB9755029.1 DUF3754 domain-containing protein [Myxococcales bacterium]
MAWAVQKVSALASSTTARADVRVLHIPMSRRAIVDALLERAREDGEGALVSPEQFAELAEILQAIYHFEMHGRLEGMKDDYAPFNPDREVVIDDGLDAAAHDKSAERLRQSVERVLERGNYALLRQSEILRAFSERSLFPVDLHVDMDFFDEFMVYARGESIRQETVATWFGLYSRTHEVPAHDRVCLFIRCKDDAHIPGKKRKRMGVTHHPGMILLKLFRNIPKNDLEMLFPSFELRMRMIDKLLLGVPALAAGVPVLAKLGPALVAMGVLVGLAEGRMSSASLITGLTGLVMLGTYLFTQWSRFQFQKALFMRVLSENLYFRNLDNNEGVLTRLIDDAEEEECKEALLAYFFLLRAGGEMSGETLDEQVEAWLLATFGFDIDFDVSDALRKLEELGIGLATEAEGTWRAIPIDDALALVHRRWDDYFIERRRAAVARAAEG